MNEVSFDSFKTKYLSRFDKNLEVLYVFVTESQPGYVKIGMSSKGIFQRASSNDYLTTHGKPGYFWFFYIEREYKNIDIRKIEGKALKDIREKFPEDHKGGTEMFYLGIEFQDKHLNIILEYIKDTFKNEFQYYCSKVNVRELRTFNRQVLVSNIHNNIVSFSEVIPKTATKCDKCNRKCSRKIFKCLQTVDENTVIEMNYGKSCFQEIHFNFKTKAELKEKKISKHDNRYKEMIEINKESHGINNIYDYYIDYIISKLISIDSSVILKNNKEEILSLLPYKTYEKMIIIMFCEYFIKDNKNTEFQISFDLNNKHSIKSLSSVSTKELFAILSKTTIFECEIKDNKLYIVYTQKCYQPKVLIDRLNKLKNHHTQFPKCSDDMFERIIYYLNEEDNEKLSKILENVDENKVIIFKNIIGGIFKYNKHKLSDCIGIMESLDKFQLKFLYESYISLQGGGGCGKSKTIKVVLQILYYALPDKVQIICFGTTHSNKENLRMSVNNVVYKVVHYLNEYSIKTLCNRYKDSTVLIAIDEDSMIDIFQWKLILDLFEAFKSEKILTFLVGDMFQLDTIKFAKETDIVKTYIYQERSAILQKNYRQDSDETTEEEKKYISFTYNYRYKYGSFDNIDKNIPNRTTRGTLEDIKKESVEQILSKRTKVITKQNLTVDDINFRVWQRKQEINEHNCKKSIPIHTNNKVKDKSIICCDICLKYHQYVNSINQRYSKTKLLHDTLHLNFNKFVDKTQEEDRFSYNVDDEGNIYITYFKDNVDKKIKQKDIVHYVFISEDETQTLYFESDMSDDLFYSNNEYIYTIDWIIINNIKCVIINDPDSIRSEKNKNIPYLKDANHYGDLHTKVRPKLMTLKDFRKLMEKCKLTYAETIHKSQGLSYDNVSLLQDLPMTSKETYVILTRTRDILNGYHQYIATDIIGTNLIAESKNYTKVNLNEKLNVREEYEKYKDSMDKIGDKRKQRTWLEMFHNKQYEDIFWRISTESGIKDIKIIKGVCTILLLKFKDYNKIINHLNNENEKRVLNEQTELILKPEATEYMLQF